MSVEHMELARIRVLNTPGLACVYAEHPSKGGHLWYFNGYPHPRIEGAPCPQTMMYHLTIEGDESTDVFPTMVQVIDDGGTHRYWTRDYIEYTNETDYFKEIN